MYEQVIEACLRREASQWEIGDALIEECGPPGKNGTNNGSLTKLKEAAEELARNGMPYALVTLRNYRDLAHMWPAPRGAAVSWSVYREFMAYPQLLKSRLKKNPDMVMTVADAKQLVTAHDKRKREAEENEQPTEQPESVSEVSEPTSDTPVVDTQFVPDQEPVSVVAPPNDKTSEITKRANDAFEEVWAVATDMVTHIKDKEEVPAEWRELEKLVADARDKFSELLRALHAKKPAKSRKPNLKVVSDNELSA